MEDSFLFDYIGHEKTEHWNQIHDPLIFFGNQVSCTVPGKPFAKQRPRASRKGSFMKIYTPRETIEYENLVKYTYYQENGEMTLEGPLRARIVATFPIPTSISKKKQKAMEEGKLPHTKKPDVDNVAKSCLDALNHVAFYDDSQIIQLDISKKYGRHPNVFIELTELNPIQEDE